MGAQRFAYQPALDGLRAVSIVIVLVFHLGAPWMAGGYLGVSTFFTLSGFLITSLLLDERERSGRIDVGAFYVRRLRRLLPASLVCLFLVSLAAGAGLVAERSDLRASVLAALAQVANWEALLGGRSYADLFLAPSPVEHFWSLAIEEQFYWVWPLAVLAITRRGGARRVTGTLVGLFVALSVGAVVTAQTLGGDAAYLASWARFAEILAGAALAAVLARRSLPAWSRWLAPPALLLIVVLSVVTPSGRGWAYEGGLPVFSLVTVALIAGLQVDGPVRRLLAARPLVAVGLVSYGLYLFHWPVFTILDGDRTGLDGLPLAVVRLGVTVAVTLVSYRLLEQPIRRGRVLQPAGLYLRSLAVAVPALAAIAVLVVPVQRVPEVTPTAEPVVLGSLTSSLASASIDAPPLAPAQAELAAWSAPTVEEAMAATQTVAAASAVDAVPAGPRTVAMFGDSIADWLLIRAAGSFSRTDVAVIDAAQAACDGMVGLPQGRDRHLRLLELPPDCRPWTESYAPVLEDPAHPVDVAVLVLGQAPSVDRLVGTGWVTPCDGIDWYTDDLRERIRYAREHAGEVVFVLPAFGGEKATWALPDDHLQRLDCIRRDLQTFLRGMAVRTVDLNEVLCPDGPDGPCTDRHAVDGTHVDPEDSPFVLEWLLDEVLKT